MDMDLSEAIREAAVALMHREIVAHGEVRLTQADFAAAEAATERGQAIQLALGPNEILIFTHANVDAGKAVS